MTPATLGSNIKQNHFFPEPFTVNPKLLNPKPIVGLRSAHTSAAVIFSSVATRKADKGPSWLRGFGAFLNPFSTLWGLGFRLAHSHKGFRV